LQQGLKEKKRLIRNELSEQDVAFQESLRIDKEKDERRQQEEQLKQDEINRLLKEEEERQRLLEEEVRIQEMKKEQKERDKKLLFSKLPPEPEKGDNVVQLMIRLLNGSRVTRRFHLDSQINELYLFVQAQEDVEDFFLGTHFPKKEFRDKTQTFREVEIPLNAMIIVDKD